jgi:peptidoglycan/LPS O-acetylase OafA/YrhL
MESAYAQARPVTGASSGAAGSEPPARSRFLTHIQALRALAVLLVVLYHLSPRHLSGGYVGVDVFFVISGYLMTRHLVGRSDAGVPIRRALNEFYLRRIRRIAPASLVMLAVTALVVLTAVSEVHWDSFFHEILASTLYYENWSLAASSTDYLAAGTGASPVEHFWSLSVEEQFYLVWPLLLLGVGVLAAARRRAVQFVLVIVLGGVSLAYGQHALSVNAAAAYFDTFARLWEFAVGGLLAVVGSRLRLAPALSALLSWAGLAMIAYSAYYFSGNTAFPGYAALVPVLGAFAVIAAGERAPWFGPQGIMALRPIQFIGDISYSVYLWHFPLIALWYPVLNEKLTNKTRLVVLVLSIVLGYLSKVLVEDRFRTAPPAGGRRTAKPARRGQRRAQPTRRRNLAYVGLVVGMIPALAIAGGALLDINHQESTARAALARFEAERPDCYGGITRQGVPGCTAGAVPIKGVIPSPLIASAGFEAGPCQQRSRSLVKSCVFGSTKTGATQVALVGDSHATQWLPALKDIAVQQGWRLTTYLESGCPLSSAHFDATCDGWNVNVMKRLVQARYAFVIVAARGLTTEGAGALPGQARGLSAQWAKLQAAGSHVIAMKDVPQPADAGVGDIPTCVYDHGNTEKCTFDETRATRLDFVHLAAEQTSGVSLVDMTRYFCAQQRCQAVIGHVLVYLDDNHMTPLYSESLVRPLAEQLRTAGLG